MYYIYDAEARKLIVGQFSGGCILEDDEIRILARDEGMTVSNWGKVFELQMGFEHPEFDPQFTD